MSYGQAKTTFIAYTISVLYDQIKCTCNGLMIFMVFHSTTMEPCVVWEFPSPPTGDLDCRDVIIQKPCIVEAQPTGNYANEIASRSRWDSPIQLS